ncbi:MAG: hypothetical protein ACLTDR_14570 [Adlercreutzia equolifaciens]
MRILVVNAGSSSLKSQLIETDGKVSLMKCLAEKVGTPDAYMNVSFAPDFQKAHPSRGGHDRGRVLEEAFGSARRRSGEPHQRPLADRRHRQPHRGRWRVLHQIRDH